MILFFEFKELALCILIIVMLKLSTYKDIIQRELLCMKIIWV